MKVVLLGPAPDILGLESIWHYFARVLKSVKANGFIKIMVAYGQVSGWSIIQPLLQQITQKSNRFVEIIVGIDNFGTTPVFIKQAIDTLGAPHVFIYHNPADATFHPKFYLIKCNHKEAVLVLGSSNLTSHGLQNNFEINLAVKLDLQNDEDKEFFQHCDSLFEAIKRAPSTMTAASVLDKLTTAFCESLQRQWEEQQSHALQNVQDSLRTLFKSTPHRQQHHYKRRPLKPQLPVSPKAPRHFIMTLAKNDVSGRRGEPYILIPIVARNESPEFWGWQKQFQIGRKYLERRFTLQVTIQGQTQEEKSRLYYVPERSEFRLRSDRIYRLGEAYAGCLIKLSWKENVCRIKLIEPDDLSYSRLIKKCVLLKQGKLWGYI